MIEWNALLQAFVTSGVLATAVGIWFKKYTERRIEHIFDKKLKEFEAHLKVATELQIGFGKDRIEEYKKLSSLVQVARKDAVALWMQPVPAVDDISGLLARIKDLQDLIYSLSVTLNVDQLYERVHSYKVELATLVKNLDNERNLRDNRQTERADGVRMIIDRSISDIQGECRSIVALLVDVVSAQGEPEYRLPKEASSGR